MPLLGCNLYMYHHLTTNYYKHSSCYDMYTHCIHKFLKFRAILYQKLILLNSRTFGKVEMLQSLPWLFLVHSTVQKKKKKNVYIAATGWRVQTTKLICARAVSEAKKTLWRKRSQYHDDGGWTKVRKIAANFNELIY